MRTIKALFTTVAATALSALLATSAFAAVTLESSAYDNDAGTIDATGYTATEGQMTAIVVEASKWNAIGETDLTVDDLLYINQFDADDAEATLTNIGLKGLLTEDVEYYVLLGGDNAEDIQILSITYTEDAEETATIVLGDVDLSGGWPDTNDISLMLNHVLEIDGKFLEGWNLLVADVDGNKTVDTVVNGDIDTNDIAVILNTILNEDARADLRTVEVPVSAIPN